MAWPSLRVLLGRALGVLLAVAVPAPGLAQDQDSGPLRISVDRESGALEIRLGDLFGEAGLVRALHSGLPLRIQVKAELWKDGFFDSQRGRGEWRASVLFDPLERRYRVATGGEVGVELSLDSLSEVQGALQAAFALPLRPMEAGRYYYLGHFEVETLSLSDLDELQRWLRGDLATAVNGEERVGTALGRGAHRVLVRMLGIPARRYRVRTERFTFEAPDPA